MMLSALAWTSLLIKSDEDFESEQAASQYVKLENFS